MDFAVSFPSVHTWPHVLLLPDFRTKFLPYFFEFFKPTTLYPLRVTSAVGPAGIISFSFPG